MINGSIDLMNTPPDYQELVGVEVPRIGVISSFP